LAKDTPTAVGIAYAESAEGILDLTIEANLITAGDAQVNAYAIRNTLLLARRQARVR
jgi:hypothetical protein